MKFAFQTVFLAALINLVWLLSRDLWGLGRRAVWWWRGKKLRARMLRDVRGAMR